MSKTIHPGLKADPTFLSCPQGPEAAWASAFPSGKLLIAWVSLSQSACPQGYGVSEIPRPRRGDVGASLPPEPTVGPVSGWILSVGAFREGWLQGGSRADLLLTRREAAGSLGVFRAGPVTQTVFSYTLRSHGPVVQTGHPPAVGDRHAPVPATQDASAALPGALHPRPVGFATLGVVLEVKPLGPAQLRVWSDDESASLGSHLRTGGEPFFLTPILLQK